MINPYLFRSSPNEKNLLKVRHSNRDFKEISKSKRLWLVRSPFNIAWLILYTKGPNISKITIFKAKDE